ncbi:hypothetical protein Tco_0417032 [Tanacetum coccineum]
MVGPILFVDACLPLCDYAMSPNLISPLWAVKAVLHLCVYYFATTISCRIVVGKIDPYLGRAAPRRACSHGWSHTLLSTSAISDLCPTFSLRLIYHRALRIFMLRFADACFVNAFLMAARLLMIWAAVDGCYGYTSVGSLFQISRVEQGLSTIMRSDSGERDARMIACVADACFAAVFCYTEAVVVM